MEFVSENLVLILCGLAGFGLLIGEAFMPGIGVAGMAYALRRGRPNRCGKEYGLHCLEVLAAMEESASSGKSAEVASRFVMEPLKPGYYSGLGGMRGDAERSLMD